MIIFLNIIDKSCKWKMNAQSFLVRPLQPHKGPTRPKTPKTPKTRKICPKTRIIGEILSRFFLVQALGTYTMTIWPCPQLSIAWAWVMGAQKGPKWAQYDQKLEKYVSKLQLLVGYFSRFFLAQVLRTCTMTIWPGPQLSIAQAWVRGAQKGAEGAQNDQELAKTRKICP